MMWLLEEEIRESSIPNPRLEIAYRNSHRRLKLVNFLLDFSARRPADPETAQIA